MAPTPHALWVVSRGCGTVTRYDKQTQKGTVAGVSSSPYDVADDADGNVWVTDRKPVVTWILRAASGTGTAALPEKTKVVPVPLSHAGAEALGPATCGVIPGPLFARSHDRVALVDIRTRRLVSSIPVHGESTAIAFDFGRAWIGTYDPRDASAWPAVVRPGSRVNRLRLESNDGWGPLGIATGAGTVWVLTSAGHADQGRPRDAAHAADPDGCQAAGVPRLRRRLGLDRERADSSVSRIDPHSNRVQTIRLAATGRSPAESRRRTTPSGSRSATRTATQPIADAATSCGR
jgi:hypothetical protein